MFLDIKNTNIIEGEILTAAQTPRHVADIKPVNGGVSAFQKNFDGALRGMSQVAESLKKSRSIDLGKGVTLYPPGNMAPSMRKIRDVTPL